jgi:hypothetical protein
VKKVIGIFFILMVAASFILIPAAPTFAATLQVGPGKPYATIQSAVEAASPGDTVKVYPGTYDEQVFINKDLNLQGYGDRTVIKPSSNGILAQHYTISWAGGTKEVAGVIMADAASSVVVNKLKIDGGSITDVPGGSNWVAGVSYRETGGVIDNVSVTNMTIGATGTDVRGYGIVMYAGTAAVSVEVKGCSISNYDKNGINAQGGQLTASIHDNTISGRGPLPDGDEVQNGILIIDNATGMVNNNKVSGNVYAPAAWGATGIAFINAGGSAQDNTLKNNQMGAAAQVLPSFGSGTSWLVSFTGNQADASGIDVPGICGLDAATYVAGVSLMVTMNDNKLTGGPGDGISIGDIADNEPLGDVIAIISENLIYHWEDGIHLYSSVAGGSAITGNTIIDNASEGSGIHLEIDVNAASVGVYDNNIDKNELYGVFNGGTGILDARNNWWGSPTGPSGVGIGSGDQASSNVNFTPWLVLPYQEYRHPGPFKLWPRHPWTRWPHWPKMDK